MAQNLPWTLQGQSIILTTNATPSTSQSAQILLTNFNLSEWPPSIRVYNAGSSAVWFSITTVTTVVVIPAAGTTTAGTPEPVTFLAPGIVEAMGFPGSNSDIVWINTISAVASQNIYISPGEGE
jgi:hypothetical protein